MVNIYLFIELLHTANAAATVDTLKALQMDNCRSPMWWCCPTRSWWPNSTARVGGRHQGDPQRRFQGRRRGADQHHRRRAARAALALLVMPAKAGIQ
jgi:hypothetical protein